MITLKPIQEYYDHQGNLKPVYQPFDGMGAFDGDKMVGSVLWCDEDFSGNFFVGHFFVLPEYRGTAGAMLMRFIAQERQRVGRPMSADIINPELQALHDKAKQRGMIARKTADWDDPEWQAYFDANQQAHQHQQQQQRYFKWLLHNRDGLRVWEVNGPDGEPWHGTQANTLGYDWEDIPQCGYVRLENGSLKFNDYDDEHPAELEPTIQRMLAGGDASASPQEAPGSHTSAWDDLGDLDVDLNAGEPEKAAQGMPGYIPAAFIWHPERGIEGFGIYHDDVRQQMAQRGVSHQFGHVEGRYYPGTDTMTTYNVNPYFNPFDKGQYESVKQQVKDGFHAVKERFRDPMVKRADWDDDVATEDKPEITFEQQIGLPIDQTRDGEGWQAYAGWDDDAYVEEHAAKPPYNPPNGTILDTATLTDVLGDPDEEFHWDDGTGIDPEHALNKWPATRDRMPYIYDPSNGNLFWGTPGSYHGAILDAMAYEPDYKSDDDDDWPDLHSRTDFVCGAVTNDHQHMVWRAAISPEMRQHLESLVGLPINDGLDPHGVRRAAWDDEEDFDWERRPYREEITWRPSDPDAIHVPQDDKTFIHEYYRHRLPYVYYPADDKMFWGHPGMVHHEIENYAQKNHILRGGGVHGGIFQDGGELRHATWEPDLDPETEEILVHKTGVPITHERTGEGVIDPERLHRDSKTAMAADPEWWKTVGPLYHSTPPENAEVIERDGLIPWNQGPGTRYTPLENNPANPLGDDDDSWNFFEPRPDHVYLSTNPKPLGSNHVVFQVDPRHLDPQHVNPDEDWVNDGGSNAPIRNRVFREMWGDGSGSWGEMAENYGLGNDPSHTQMSHEYGSIAYRGKIPPHALKRVSKTSMAEKTASSFRIVPITRGDKFFDHMGDIETATFAGGFNLFDASFMVGSAVVHYDEALKTPKAQAWGEENNVYVESLYVKPEYRQTPAVSYLLRAVKEFADSHGAGIFAEYDNEKLEAFVKRHAMAERTGDPELDKLIEEFLDENWAGYLEEFTMPDVARGQCADVSEFFAKWLRDRGVDAEIHDITDDAGPGDPASTFDGAGYGDAQMRDPKGGWHTTVEVNMPSGTYMIDWTAAQYGYTEFPMVQRLNDGNWQRKWTANLAQQHQQILDRNRGEDLKGLPGAVNVPGYGHMTFGSHKGIQDLAKGYMQSAGLPYDPPRTYARVDPQRAQRIAAHYGQMRHAPNDPQVKASYDAMIRETLAQYQHLKNAGYEFEFYPEHDPYPNSPREALLDLHRNKHMYVFPTVEGFGTVNPAEHDNPLLQDSGERWNGKPVTYNDIFRAVHDVFGHAKNGVGFRADGEENAWRAHSAMYSPQARGAMTAETRGQNSWVNYGPHGEQNQKAGQGDTVYADQKTGLLPEWITHEGAKD